MKALPKQAQVTNYQHKGSLRIIIHQKAWLYTIFIQNSKITTFRWTYSNILKKIIFYFGFSYDPYGIVSLSTYNELLT